MLINSTLSGKKELLLPIHNNRVNLFVCGPTVYDNSHIGHARTYIVFDVVARYLKHKGYSVFYLQNVTDVDDKIIQRATETDASPRLLARKFEQKYLEDMQALGVTNVSYYARASEHIPEIINQIERLIEKGYAYETETGVYFDESRFHDFGKLSHQSVEDLEKHRIEPDPTKRNPGDFSLWKKRQDGPEVTWDSPWGKGRPGWHIEDTAITENYFGAQYDIHGGAMDLIFPHHEAEIAQMEATSGKKPLVRFWMHTGFLNVNGEKMSKSLGNFTTIRDMLKKFDADSFRFFVLSSHYRSPIDFSEDALDQSKKSLERIRQAAKLIEAEIEGSPSTADVASSEKEANDPSILEARARFLDSMENDFNTPYALRAVFEMVRDINRRLNEKSISRNALIDARNLLDEFGQILGIGFSPATGSRAENSEDKTGKLIELLIDMRQKLREKKDWALADEIRNRLTEQGIVLEDAKTGGGKYSIR
ncbi:MAG: cysteine--tRNA ligase [Methanothrix sp.]|nr:MAG: cysteine--tRNA ligase [Methanothrix sp.]